MSKMFKLARWRSPRASGTIAHEMNRAAAKGAAPMALAIDDRPSLAERAQKLRLIDTDIHNDLPSLNELRPYLAREFHPGWRMVAPLSPAATTPTPAPG
jgi:hypothetical protein